MNDHDRNILSVRFDCVSLSSRFIFIIMNLMNWLSVFTHILKMVRRTKKHRSLINSRVNEIHRLAQFKRTKMKKTETHTLNSNYKIDKHANL